MWGIGVSYGAAMHLLVWILWAISVFFAPSAAQMARQPWVEVSSADEIQTAMASASDATFLRVADSVPRCCDPIFLRRTYYHPKSHQTLVQSIVWLTRLRLRALRSCSGSTRTYESEIF